MIAGGIQMSAGPEVTSTPQAALSQPLADPDAEAVPAPATRRGPMERPRPGRVRDGRKVQAPGTSC